VKNQTTPLEKKERKIQTYQYIFLISIPMNLYLNKYLYNFKVSNLIIFDFNYLYDNIIFQALVIK